MYQYLFNRFTTELSEAAGQGTKLQQSILNGNLANPYQLSQAIYLNLKMPSVEKKISQLIKYSLTNYGSQNHDKVYEYIKSEILNQHGILPVSDPKHPYNKLLNQENENQSYRPSMIDDNKMFLKSDTLSTLCYFFFEFKKQILNLN